ncbi:MAG: 30S ribosomal protein S6 [Oligoflexia bacterium]|nr:30S ribosomal protein S6 [Oligoflexia bacterium]
MSAQTQAASAVRAGYETTYITRSEMAEDALKALQERLNAVVASFQGEVVLTEDWGRRKLAYPIQKEGRGHYTYIVYSGKGDIVHEIERNLRLNDQVLRFLTVNLETEFDAEAFRKQRAAIHAAAQRREEEREARREERMAERGGGEYRRHSAPAADDVGAGSEE